VATAILGNVSPNPNVKYDDWGWHTGGVFPADQPQINGFTHIGMYLVWIIKHGLHEPGVFGGDIADGVKAGTITANDLADTIDGKLTAEEMAPEGIAFSNWYYTGESAYLSDWAATFSGRPDYTTTDTPATYASIERVIDRRYAEWVKAGQPLAGAATITSPRRLRMARLVPRYVYLGLVAGVVLAVAGVLLRPAGVQGVLVGLGIVLVIASTVVLIDRG
jgi:hypothetical protein